MRRRLVTLSGWLATASLVVITGIPTAFSQPAFPTGSFVVAGDGSRWVVGNGMRLRIVFAADDTQTIPTLAEGATVRTVAEAVAALGGGGGTAAPPAAGPAATPTPLPNPAQTLIGQQVNACGYGVPFTFAVADAQWVKNVAGVDAPGNAMWAVAFMDVTNQGTTPTNLYNGQAKVRDDRGREFPWAEYPPDPVDVARALGVKGRFENFAPGITERSVMLFAVPADARTLTLIGLPVFC